MPTKQCVRADEERLPARSPQKPAGRSQEDTIGVLQTRAGDLPAKNHKLMSKYNDLELLELTRTQTQRRHRERTPKQQIHQRHDQEQTPSTRMRTRPDSTIAKSPPTYPRSTRRIYAPHTLSSPTRAQHARQAALTDCGLPGALRAAAGARAGAAHRSRAARRAGRVDCFYVGRLRGSEGAIWQLTAIDVCSSFAWAELVICKQGNPTAAQTSTLARRVARELKAAGWRLDRILADNGNEFRGERFHATLTRLGAKLTHIHAGRPQTNGHVEALHKTILEECWRPAFARYLHPRYSSLKRELDRYLAYYTPTASTTAASPAAASPPTSSTVPTR
jgi:transposase InsO family protein